MADRWATIAGGVVLAVGVVMIAVAGVTLYHFVQDPSARAASLKTPVNVTSEGPTASFSWASQGYNVTFTDTSTDNGSTITSWLWTFGDGTSYAGSAPPTHAYAVTCRSCNENVALAVQDAEGRGSSVSTSVLLQQVGSSSGVASAPSPASKLPSLGPLSNGVIATLELLALLILIAASTLRAAWNLLRREPQAVTVPVVPARPPA